MGLQKKKQKQFDWINIKSPVSIKCDFSKESKNICLAKLDKPCFGAADSELFQAHHEYTKTKPTKHRQHLQPLQTNTLHVHMCTNNGLRIAFLVEKYSFREKAAFQVMYACYKLYKIEILEFSSDNITWLTFFLLINVN